MKYLVVNSGRFLFKYCKNIFQTFKYFFRKFQAPPIDERVNMSIQARFFPTPMIPPTLVRKVM